MAFLVRVSISAWTARKKDKVATNEAKARARAGDKAGVAVYKSVLAADALDKVHTIANAARQEHKKRTVPYAYDGPGLITVEGYPAYKASMAAFEKDFNAAVADFASVYAYERDKAHSYLGDLFDERDYPTLDSVKSKFAFHVSAEPLPEAQAFRGEGLAPELVAEIKENIVQNNMDALDGAKKTAWTRVLEAVEKLKLKMDSYKPGAKGVREENGFHATTITNISELADMIPSINVTNDPGLARMQQKLMALMLYTAEELKGSDALRAHIAKEAGAILADIGDAYKRA